MLRGALGVAQVTSGARGVAACENMTLAATAAAKPALTLPPPLPCALQIEKAQERARLESQPKPLRPEQQAEVDGLLAQAKGGWAAAGWRCFGRGGAPTHA